jgi:hypothetical protein
MEEPPLRSLRAYLCGLASKLIYTLNKRKGLPKKAINSSSLEGPFLKGFRAKQLTYFIHRRRKFLGEAIHAIIALLTLIIYKRAKELNYRGKPKDSPEYIILKGTSFKLKSKKVL